MPGEIRAQLGLARGERVLAVGYDPAGQHALIATNRALHHHAFPAGWSCLGWEQVAAAGWDRAANRLVVTGLDGIAPSRTAMPLGAPGALVELAGERIAHTRLGRWKVVLDSGRRVLVEVRRRPVTDELVWAAADGQIDPRDAGVREQIDHAVARLGEHLGVSHHPGAERGLPLRDPLR